MARRKNEEEGIGPVVDGLSSLAELIPAPVIEQDLEELAEDTPFLDEREEEGAEAPVLLIFGEHEEAFALGNLASGCGFDVRYALPQSGEDQIMDAPRDSEIMELADFGNLVEDCGIERNFFICIFTEDAVDCELILSQCLASDACYIGMAGESEKIAEVFEALRKDGAPDAELAAVAAPLGLNIGASNPDQKAVAIVAEMLAAKAGKLKRLRQGGRRSAQKEA